MHLPPLLPVFHYVTSVSKTLTKPRPKDWICSYLNTKLYKLTVL